MTHCGALSVESICTVLSCTSEEFWDLYTNEAHETDALSADAVNNVIGPNRDRLRVAKQPYCLDVLLVAMLEHAPHPLGEKGPNRVVDVAQAWMDCLFLPMLAMYKADKTNSSGSQTPTIDELNLRQKVATRERYYCAITHFFDSVHAQNLVKRGLEADIPKGVHQAYMEVAHIIPLKLSSFEETTAAAVHSAFSFFAAHLEVFWAQRNGALTRDMLQAWTQINFHKLAGSNSNTPANTIYMVRDQHTSFGQFDFYLDKEAYPDAPNKYKVQMARKGFEMNARDPVEFPTLAESGIDPPNPEFLWVHAAFAKVLNLSGAAEYIERLEGDAKDNDALLLNKEVDYTTLLFSKFAIIAH